MKNMKKNFVLYVTAPFTHEIPEIRERRFRSACRASALLMAAGVVVFSPLSHSMPIVQHGELDEMDSDFWLTMDLPLLERSDELLVLALDDWERSKGVVAEMFFALKHHKPITLIGESDIKRLPAIPRSARKYLDSNILTEVYDD